jgi:ribose transport system substrate-binding protein
MMKREISPVNIITVLDNDTLQDTAALLKDAKKDAKIYGVGCSDKTIYNLDNGKIDGMVVPNEYTMGYVSLLKAAMRVKNRLYKVEDTSVNFFKITKENLYSTENQKMIFPIVG